MVLLLLLPVSVKSVQIRAILPCRDGCVAVVVSGVDSLAAVALSEVDSLISLAVDVV